MSLDLELEAFAYISEVLSKTDVFREVGRMKLELKQRGHYGPYFLVSSFEVERDVDILIYDNIGISEAQRIKEMPDIIGWNQNKEGINARARELSDKKDRTLFLVQCTGWDYEEAWLDKMLSKIDDISNACERLKKEIVNFKYNRRYYIGD